MTAFASIGGGSTCCTAVRSVGDHGLLVEVDDIKSVHRVVAWLHEHALRQRLVEVIGGARTIYLSGPPSVLRSVYRDLREAALPSTAVPPDRGVVTIDVRYDGIDLVDVSRQLDLTRSELIELHTSLVYTVHFFGFSPGHAFLGELPPRLRVPRRSSPRLRVPSGALAIANEFTVIYPQDLPGGWNLIGSRVSRPLWNIEENPPNVLDVGDRVRFRAVE